MDGDIKGFFDSIPHELRMKAVEKHTSCKWHRLYIKRWLTAPLQAKEGVLHTRDKGTPQGAVVSPVRANLFLHYCMDRWLKIHYPQCPFERSAEDAVIHCRTEAEAQEGMEALRQRLEECGLPMHPQKTKVVYCKDSTARAETEAVSPLVFWARAFSRAGPGIRRDKALSASRPPVAPKPARR